MPFAALRAVQTVVLTAILVPCAYMTEPVQSSRDFPAVVTALNGGRNAPHWQKCPECGNRVARSYVYKHLCRQDGRVDNRKRSKPTPALEQKTSKACDAPKDQSVMARGADKTAGPSSARQTRAGKFDFLSMYMMSGMVVIPISAHGHSSL